MESERTKIVNWTDLVLYDIMNHYGMKTVCQAICYIYSRISPFILVIIAIITF